MRKEKKVVHKFIYLWVMIIAIVAGFFPMVLLTPSVNAATVGNVEMNGDPSFDSDSVTNGTSKQYRWLSYPGARFSINPTTQGKMNTNLPLNIGGYLGNGTVNFSDVVNVQVSSPNGVANNANSLSTTWYPYKITFDASYNTPSGVSIAGYDFFADANSSIIRVVKVNGNTDKELILSGTLPSGAQWDAVNKVLVVQNAEYYYALRFVSLSGSGLTSSDISQTPTISGSTWSLRIPVGTVSGNQYGIGFGFAAQSEGMSTAVLRAKNSFSQDVTTTLGNTKNTFDSYLKKVPLPSKYGISSDVPNFGVTSDQHRRAYYAAWTFLLDGKMNVLPENSANYNYIQILCGKPSLWSGGANYSKGTAAWESFFGQMWLSYILPPAEAWNAFKGIMTNVDSNGYMAGEVLPSIKAQTAWVIYKNGGASVSELAAEYSNIKRYLLWLENNPRWIFGLHDNAAEKDMEFAVSFVFDADFAIKIANEIGETADVSMWQTKQTNMTNNIRTWFLSDPAKLHQFYFSPNEYYWGDRSSDSHLSILNAIIISGLTSAENTRLMNAFNSKLDLTAGVGGEGYKYPLAALDVYGMLSKGYTLEAKQYMNTIIRDTIRVGDFSEAITEVPSFDGGVPTDFSAIGMIDFTLMLNGLSTYTGTPTALNLTVFPSPPPASYLNLAQNQPVTVSSIERMEFPGTGAVDGDSGTRWSSLPSDPQWIYVDLGTVRKINRVKLHWEAAYGKSYKIQVSSDAASWTDVFSTTSGNGGIDQISFSDANARYVRMYGTERGTPYGYSLWEFEVSSDPNMALNKQVTVSSTENSSEVPGQSAVDGDISTRWSSLYSDPQWIYVDLGAIQNINRVKLNWQEAYGKSYKIQVSSDAVHWTDVYSTSSGDGGVDNISFAATDARYVRMYGTQRGTQYGYSLWDFGVYYGYDVSIGGAVTDNGASNPAGEEETKAFDKASNTKWLVFSTTGSLKYDFSGDAAYKVTKYKVTSANDFPGRDPKSWTLQGSNDGVIWTTVDTQSNQTFAARLQTNEYSISNNISYQMYQLNVTANSGESYLQIAELQLLGK